MEQGGARGNARYMQRQANMHAYLEEVLGRGAVLSLEVTGKVVEALNELRPNGLSLSLWIRHPLHHSTQPAPLVHAPHPPSLPPPLSPSSLPPCVCVGGEGGGGGDVQTKQQDLG
jgi:hypothetical protein